MFYLHLLFLLVYYGSWKEVDLQPFWEHILVVPTVALSISSRETWLMVRPKLHIPSGTMAPRNGDTTIWFRLKKDCMLPCNVKQKEPVRMNPFGESKISDKQSCKSTKKRESIALLFSFYKFFINFFI